MRATCINSLKHDTGSRLAEGKCGPNSWGCTVRLLVIQTHQFTPSQQG